VPGVRTLVLLWEIPYPIVEASSILGVRGESGE